METGERITHPKSISSQRRASMKVGDLIVPTKRMRDFGYHEVGVIIKIWGGRSVVAFPDGSSQTFHPNHLKPDKK